MAAAISRMTNFIRHGFILLGLIAMTIFMAVAVVLGALAFCCSIIFVVLETGWYVGRGAMSKLGDRIDRGITKP